MSRIVHGNHPLNVPKNQPMRIGHEQVGYFTYPDIEYLAASDLNCLYISTDKLTLGYYEFQGGGQFDPPDHHPGDECYYILEGQLTETNCFSGQAAPSSPEMCRTTVLWAACPQKSSRKLRMIQAYRFSQPTVHLVDLSLK